MTPYVVHVLAHHFGEDVGEDEDLAFALVGVGEVAEHLADELAVHLAFGVAHLFVADGDPGFAHAELQFLNHAEHGLPAGGAGVLHGLDGLAFQARRVGHQSGEQSLLVEREIARRADAAHVQCRAGSAPIWRQAPWMAASIIWGTVMPISLPNFDW